MCWGRFADDKEGNTALAQYLWGYSLWTRAHQLRGLVAFVRARGIETLEDLRAWAETSTFGDFEGQVKGLGPTVYQWLVMRLGIETVKPDTHVMNFVTGAVGHRVSEQEAVHGLETAATMMGMKAKH